MKALIHEMSIQIPIYKLHCKPLQCHKVLKYLKYQTEGQLSFMDCHRLCDMSKCLSFTLPCTPHVKLRTNAASLAIRCDFKSC